MILVPKVLMMRQPPESVPNPIAVAQEAITHVGIRTSLPPGMTWNATRASVMTPIVFWASFCPWLKATRAAERRWSHENSPLTFAGLRVGEQR